MIGWGGQNNEKKEHVLDLKYPERKRLEKSALASI